MDKFTILSIAVILFLLTVPNTGGTTDGRVDVCEFNEVNLIFPNTPATSAGDIKAKTWNKDNGIQLAYWMESTNFVVEPLYRDRLTAIGENSIKIWNATRSDAGTYILVLTIGSKQDFKEFVAHLDVLVSPSDQCTPYISREGDTLVGELPLEGCGSPRLSPIWMNRTQRLTNGSINVLDIGLGLRHEIYIVCALGESRRCFQGDAKHLCANYTEPWPKNEYESRSLKAIIIPAIIVPSLMIVTVILVYYLRKKWNQAKSSNVPEENCVLIELDTKVLTDIKRYLINQYETMIGVELCPSGEENFVNVSEVYCDLQITSVRTEDLEERANVAFLKDILNTDKTYGNTAENVPLTPAVILGQCGIGKSIWCKHLVHEWCIYQDHKETNVNEVPIVGKFEILLFVPLERKLEGNSFVEYLRNQLFCSAANYFERTINYISKHRESVLIIIDGLDAVMDNQEPIANLLTTKEIFPCTIVLTSRPAGLECLLEKNPIALRLFEIHGMGLDKSLEYAGKVLGVLNRSRHNKQNVNQYWDFLRNLQVQSLCVIPFLCLSLIFYWLDRKASSVNMTDIMFYIVECYIRRAKTRRWFLENIGKVLEDNDFDISKPIKKIKNKQCLIEYGFLLRAMSELANEIWELKLQKTKNVKSIENVNLRIDAAQDCYDLCVETGILTKTVSLKKAKEQTQIAFSHVLLFDFFLTLSLAIGKRDPFSECLPNHRTISDNSYINLMLQELTTNKRSHCKVQ
ncbi:hypothetical protein CHS0354_032888 [Potamilus streckersoni]|uniref:NACHT domain-containing protein n=1 Tax=Potamilus streckersoni TaxID=2493646 RepID=A0AAE0RWG5_9BIVA|nr:hypothetical protein CHS0354_032888 [Potamilus streckersoni]